MLRQYEPAQALAAHGQSVQLHDLIVFRCALMQYVIQRDAQARDEAEFRVRQRQVVDEAQAILFAYIHCLDARLLTDLASHRAERIGARTHIAITPETSAYAGRYHVIGGFFERDRDMGARPDAFGAMRREIREETGIQTVDIREQYCLGLVYDLALPHAEFCLVTRLRIPLDDVLHQRTPEDDEIVQLHTLPVSGESLRGFVLAQHGNISTTGEANLLLYGGWKFGDGWFEEIMRSLSSLRSSGQGL